MLPTREEAEKLVVDAEQYNPGPWGNHSRVAATCAEKIATLCEDMDSEKAYILGLLHDIGRKFGVKHLGHVYDGYKLIQLCDCLASAEGVVDVEERMEDVRRRYGSYPREKWDANVALLQYFGEKVGQDIYRVVR